MPLGSELSIVSSEPAAGATHVGGSVMLSITLHAAAIAVAAGTGLWLENRVHVPTGHASNPSTNAIRLTASVSQTNQAASLQITSESDTEDPSSNRGPDLDEAIESPVDENVWDQADLPLQDLVTEEFRAAARPAPVKPIAESQGDKEVSDATSVSTKVAAAPKPVTPSDSEQDAATEREMLPSAETAIRPESAESQPAIASTNVGAKVDIVARPLPTNQPPRFPAAALREGRSGRAVLRVTVNQEGSVSRLLIIKSSGHSDLDRAAMDGVAGWSFEPARRFGLPVTQDVAVPISFEFE